jgi:hypothetical protein
MTLIIPDAKSHQATCRFSTSEPKICCQTAEQATHMHASTACQAQLQLVQTQNTLHVSQPALGFDITMTNCNYNHQLTDSLDISSHLTLA